MEGPRPRIASLVPSGTDLVDALGLTDHLVGVSHECDHPAAEGKPELTWSTVESSKAQAIDDEIAAKRRAGEPVIPIDRERLRALAPDVVITQTQCEVCAAAPDARDLPAGAEVVALQATTVEGLYADLMRLGSALGRRERALERIEETRTALQALRDQVAGREPVAVVGLEWSMPPYVAGHWVPEVAALAGGDHLLGRRGEPSHRVTWDAISEADPDAIVVMPCGMDLEGARLEARKLVDGGSLARSPAVDRQGIWAVDARALFSRCTPAALVGGARTLAGILHPDRVPRPTHAERVSPRAR